ncbi:MAG TPA: AAA family ATPase, partial [Anaerolineales bacterium]
MNAESRPGLPPAIDKLNSWKSHRLVLLVAPRGSGKTALLRKWTKEVEGSGVVGSGTRGLVRVIWIDLGPQDNDPECFLADLAAGLDERGWPSEGLKEEAGNWISPGAHASTSLVGEGFPRFESGMTGLANALTTIQGEVILVLDHYHHIFAPKVHAAVAQLLDYPPPQVHLVIACRGEPPLPLPRL